jgi:hypothetical protein
MSASIDPENGDIVENPDPEADSEILDFTNASKESQISASTSTSSSSSFFLSISFIPETDDSV